MSTVFSLFPVLHTPRLDLVEIKQSHRPDLFRLFSNPEVTRFYNVATLTEESSAQKFIDHFQNRYKDKAAIRWGIALKEQENIIGTLGFNNFTHNHRANIGYDLLPQYWNKGLMQEALSTVLDFGFKQLYINRVEAEVMQGNKASEKVLEKLHFVKEGVLRDWMYFEGRHFDMTMFSLLRKDFEKEQQKAASTAMPLPTSAK